MVALYVQEIKIGSLEVGNALVVRTKLNLMIKYLLVKDKAVLEPRVLPAFAITFFCIHCNISDLKIHQSMWIHWPFFPKTWTKGHWPLDDLWPHVCWGHMCDSTQGSLCPMTIHQCMWIQWSILQNTTYIHIHTTYRMSDHKVSYWTQFRRDKNWVQKTCQELNLTVMFKALDWWTWMLLQRDWLTRYSCCPRPMCSSKLNVHEDVDRRKGYASCLVLTCSSDLCGFTDEFYTSNKLDSDSGRGGSKAFEVNRQIVMAFREIACGHTSMVKFNTIMNMPFPMHKDTVIEHVCVLSEVYCSQTQESMNRVADSVHERQGKPSNEVVEASASFDGTWQKRVGDNSLNGIVTAVEVIDIEYNKRLDRQRPCLEGDFSGGSNNIVQSNKSVWRRW